MRITIDRANVRIEDGKVIIDFDSPQIKNTLTAYKVQLSTLKPEDEFKIGDEVFIVLEQSDNGTKVISKEFAYIKKAFGNCSDWKKSPIRTLLNSDYYNKIAKLVGASNIIPMERDLTSLDGLDDYGSCNDRISLLSAFEYVKYHKFLGLNSKYPTWWFITSSSTPRLGRSRFVCHSNPDNVLPWSDCGCLCGVRPFLKLASSIIVLKYEMQSCILTNT